MESVSREWRLWGEKGAGNSKQGLDKLGRCGRGGDGQRTPPHSNAGLAAARKRRLQDNREKPSRRFTSTPCTFSFMWSSLVVFPSFLFFQQYPSFLYFTFFLL